MHQDNYLGKRKRKAPRRFVISNRAKSIWLYVVAHEMAKQLLLLSLIMENTFDGLENECYDIDKVVEDISEIIRSVWT